MKLLTTLAALLISFSAFSQDLIEYNEGKFSRNDGEELSLKQISDMTISYNVGHRELVKAVKLSGRSNLVNNLKILAGCSYIGLGFTFWRPWNPNDTQGFVFDEGDFDELGQFFVVVGTPLLFHGILSHSPQQKADKYFNSVALQLNEAIRATNS
tara:strand:- start:61 stop:525 length:465 start_codon:yes stop_codon:yes gene_type:complete